MRNNRTGVAGTLLRGGRLRSGERDIVQPPEAHLASEAGVKGKAPESFGSCITYTYLNRTSTVLNRDST